jgi:hypothetical protein
MLTNIVNTLIPQPVFVAISVTLILLLIAKEVLSVKPDERGEKWLRIINRSIIPLLVLFAIYIGNRIFSIVSRILDNI